MSKFQMGEIVILVKSVIQGDPDVGKECEILELPSAKTVFLYGAWTVPGEYLIRTPSGIWCAHETDMRKRPQPGIPQSVLNIFRLPVEA